MSYTIKNLREVNDAAAGHDLGAVQEARFARGDLEATDTGLALQFVKPGCRQAFAHRHNKAEEIFVVLRGAGSVKLDDEVVEIGPMDAIRIAPAVARGFEAGPEGLELLVFGPHHDRDAELITDGFWDS
jgi:mannose-6-phosphate isomerase-like protein (cupin superfamily)